MSEKTVLGQIADELLGASVPAGTSPQGLAQQQCDALEAGVRLALSALSQGSPETARAHLEEALQRATAMGARPITAEPSKSRTTPLP